MKRLIDSSFSSPIQVTVGRHPAVTTLPATPVTHGDAVTARAVGRVVARVTTVRRGAQSASMRASAPMKGGVMAGLGRRARLAVGEAHDAQDEAGLLLQFVDLAGADQVIDLGEYREFRRRVVSLFRHARRAMVAAQWTDAGELGATSRLLDLRGESKRADDYERQVLAQAAELGMPLGGNVVRLVNRGNDVPPAA